MTTDHHNSQPGQLLHQADTHSDRREVGQHLDHIGHAQPGIHAFQNRLYVVAVISNPKLFRKRYRLYEHFSQMVAGAGAQLLTVEAAFGEREFEVTTATNPWNIQVRIFDELWQKENLVNLGVNRLTQLVPGWKYFAWVDADVNFTRDSWAQDTLQALQSNKVVQMFSQTVDLTDNYEFFGGDAVPGFVAQYYKTLRYGQHEGEDLGYGSRAAQEVGREVAFDWQHYSYPYSAEGLEIDTIPGVKKLRPGHCGYAWAMRRDAYDELGGLFDLSICGANDHHMAAAFIGDTLRSANPACNPEFLDELKTWGARAERHIKPYVGYVPGMIVHNFHGNKVNRRYIDRWQILVDNMYSPRKHIKRDASGLYRFTHEAPRELIVDLRQYLAQRNEDESYRSVKD